jgi:hypothetical protein
MPKQHLRVLAHDCPRKGITLIWAKIMTLIPSAADQLFEIVTWIQILVVRGEIVEDLG